MTKAEVLWRLRRSTLELDILLHRFFHASYDDLDKEERVLFHQWVLLEDKDWQAILASEHPLVDKIRYCQVEKGKF